MCADHVCGIFRLLYHLFHIVFELLQIVVLKELTKRCVQATIVQHREELIVGSQLLCSVPSHVLVEETSLLILHQNASSTGDLTSPDSLLIVTQHHGFRHIGDGHCFDQVLTEEILVHLYLHTIELLLTIFKILL